MTTVRAFAPVLTALVLLLMAGGAATAAVARHADLRYQDLPDAAPQRQMLDVYTDPALGNAPLVVFVHGGGWRQGDKRAVGATPDALVPAGVAVAAVNYRFRPDVAVADMAADVATAVRWLRDRAGKYGADPDRIFLMGHSAGAHLVAVVGTNPEFLSRAGVPRAAIRGVVALDTGPYNVPLQMERVGPGGYGDLMRFVFGDDPATWQAVSPWHHAAADTPPFLVFYSDGRGDAPLQAIPFVERLAALGVDARAVRAVGKTHGSLMRDMGSPGDATTAEVLAFVRRLSPPQ